MKAQRALLQQQPRTHTAGFHIRELLCCEDYTLNSQELHAFYDLRQSSNILFQGSNQRWDLVKALYLEYFGEPVKVSGKQWLKLGFQGQYPETDFRGGGVLSLQLILRYVKRNRETVQLMETDTGNFFFAITAINICFFMKNYFHLSDSLIADRDKQMYCDRRALKNFCSLISTDQQSFNNFHETFLTWFYKEKWLKAAQQHPETLMQFNNLFEELKSKIKSVFEDNNLLNYEDFLEVWNST